MLSLTACCYLLFRRGNAIALDVISPVRLRLWTAAFFSSMALSHVWYMPTLYLTSAEDILQGQAIGAVLDFMTLFPSAFGMLLAMLQDRRRPLWPVFVLLAPIAIGLAACAVSHNYDLLPILYAYYLLLDIGLIIYMVRATRQYGRWLRDNYADLEHKEVWQSFVVLAIILLVFGLYTVEDQIPANKYVTQVNCMILTCYLVWRVETLSDLSQGETGDCKSLATEDCKSPSEESTSTPTDTDDTALPQTIHDKIGLLLQRHCIDTQLYLQHDLTISQLAQAIGTNRSYLSQYFSSQGITYNTYINDLRINHFIRLYQETVAIQRPFTAQQLASESGYRSYSTFRLAFQQRMNQNVRTWMRDMAGNPQNQQK